MNKKFILSFVSVLLPVLVILGFNGLVKANKPLKALENEAKLVEVTIDGKEINAETSIQEKEVIVNLSSKKEVYLVLPFNEQIQVQPLAEKDGGLLINPESETTATDFNVADWKEQFQSAIGKTSTEEIETSMQESTKTTGLTLVKEEKEGAYYFRLKAGVSQCFQITYQAESAQPIVVYEAADEKPKQQTLFNFISLDAVTSEEIVEQEAESTRDKRSTAVLEKASNLESNNPLATFGIRTDESKYNVGVEAIGQVSFTVNQGTGILNNTRIEIRIPKKYVTIAPVGSPFGLTKHVETITEGDDWVIRYYIPNINGGYNGTFPFRVTTHNGQTPNGYELPIDAQLLNEENKTLSQASTSIKWSTVPPRITKFATGWSSGSKITTFGDNYSFTGGFEDPENKEYLFDVNHLDKLVPIEYYFNISNLQSNAGYRNYDEFEIVDTLPEGALFRQEDNPDWKYDEKTNTVKYRETRKLYTYTSYESIDSKLRKGSYSLDTPKYTLYYPEAKINTKKSSLGTAILVPENQASFEQKVKIDDAITHQLYATKEPTLLGDYLFFQKNSAATVKDTIKMKETAEPKFSMYMYLKTTERNLFNRQVKNATIRDYGLDNQLYYTRVRVYSTGDTRIVNGTAQVKVLLQDGQEEVLSEAVPIGINGNSVASEVKIPESLQKQVKEVIVTANDEAILSPRSYFYLDVYTKYRNPESSLKDNLDEDSANDVRAMMYNYAEFSGSFVNNNQSFTSGEYQGVHKLLAVNQSVQLNKRMVAKQPIFLDDTVTYALNVYFTDILAEMSFDEPIVVDLLPKGFEYVPDSTIISRSTAAAVTFDNEDYNKEPEIVSDYRGTGRTALIWYLPSGTAKADYFETSNSYAYESKVTSKTDFPKLTNKHRRAYVQITYKTRVTKFAKEGRNTNDAYLSWKDQKKIAPSSTATSSWLEDVYDINDNNQKTDKVYHSLAIIDYRSPVEKLATEEAQGSLNSDFVLAPDTIRTEIGSTVNYRLRLLNNSILSEKYVKILDVLPFVGDKSVAKDSAGISYDRGSQYSVFLTGPISVPKGYTDYYSLELPDNDNYAEFYTEDTFITRDKVQDFSKVRAIKVEINEGQEFESKEQLEVTVSVSIPKDYNLREGMKANNSFGVTHTPNDSPNPLWYESSISPVEIVRYQVIGKVFNDINLDSEITDSELGFSNHKVALVDENGKPVLDLEGKPITTMTKEDGTYSMDVFRHGDYRVKILPPEGYEVTQPKEGDTMSNIYLDQNDVIADDWKDNLSTVFEFDEAHREAIRNAGYYSSEKTIHLYKYDADSVNDTNDNDKIDDNERKSARPLKNAVFEVYEGHGIDASKQLKDAKGKAITLMTGKNGEAWFLGNLSEEYTFVEVQAPTGFELSKEPIYVKNVETEQDDELWVYIANHPQTELPFAGSNRPLQLLILLFSSFMLIGLVIVIYQFIPRKRGV